MAIANIVKGWSTEIHQFVYTHMSALWQMQETPQWIKDKRLKLASKVPGNSQIKNMRPISLYEVIRKVWTTTIVSSTLHSYNDMLKKRNTCVVAKTSKLFFEAESGMRQGESASRLQ
jgi:hypothetical protein